KNVFLSPPTLASLACLARNSSSSSSASFTCLTSASYLFMRTWILVLVLVLAACRQSPSRAVLVSDVKQSPPEVLSGWRLFERRAGVLRPARDGLVYELSTPLFSDYAQKLRAIHVPPGTAIRYGEDEFAFPVDTIITKTFYYPIDEGDGGSANVVRK